MLFNGKTRRQFLIGTGPLALALPLPLLPSLLPRTAQAAGPVPLRFLHCLHAWSHPASTFFPKVTPGPLGNPSDNVNGVPLSAVPGPISKVVGSAFDELKSKINVIYGLNAVNSTGHNSSIPTCVSIGANPSVAPSIPISIEHILSTSKKVYRDGAAAEGREPFLGVVHKRPTADDFNTRIYSSFAWKPTGGKLPAVSDPRAVYSKFTGSFNPVVVDPRTDPESLMRINVMDEVHKDYKAVTAAGKISMGDKMRLEAYATLIAGVKTKLASPSLSCSNDPKPTGNDLADMVSLIAAAMACQLTRVVDFVIVPEEGMHKLGHEGIERNNASAAVTYTNNTAEYGKIFAGLWKELDRLKDPDGNSVLYNSVVAWCPANGSRGPHGGQNIGLVTAGSGGGRLRTGYYLDYGDRAYNNWLVTAMTAFGLDAADYETGGRVGFGDYYKAGTSDSEKRRPLPFLYNPPA